MNILSIEYNYKPAQRVNFRQAELPIKPVVTKSAEYTVESLALCAAAVTGAVIAKKNIPDKYIKTLAKDLSKELKKEIKVSDLKSIMTKNDFFKAVKGLKEENYIASKENIANGTFIADFHSHSDFSDGTATVDKILSQAAEYADKLNKINGKKFLFALSDHDGIDGVKEALKIIAQNPEKYKNVKFIPAAELSMPINCEHGSIKRSNSKNAVEMAELLIYGINPFSEHTNKYFSNLYTLRRNGVINTLKIASEKLPDIKFSEEEYNKFFNRKKTPYCMLNQHWRLYQYINIKARITHIAEAIGKNPEELYQEIMSDMGKGTTVHGKCLDEYIKVKNLPVNSPTYLREVAVLKDEICPKIEGQLLHAPYESSYSNILEYADNENAVLGFAHPVFTIQNMHKDNVIKNIQEMINKSKGKLIYSENYHQAYPSKYVSNNDINATNDIMNQLKLIPIGGRDMHRDNFKF